MPPRPRVSVAEHPADRAVRARDPKALPPEHRAAYHAVVTAFGDYHAGRDADARDALAAVGLGSPFLEWRVLLRGLLAHAAGDDGRAVENFARLDPGRLPARLAASVRAGLDPAFAAKAPVKVQAQGKILFADPVAAGLAAVRKQVGAGRGLDAAFRTLTGLVPVLKERSPDAVTLLGEVVYQAVRRHGTPGDLPKIKKLFGPPADDPAFHRLNALAFEDAGHPAEVTRHWLAYEAWLSRDPAGWPADVLARARATILTRVARMTAGAPVRLRGVSAPPDPVPMWERALDLAPDWDQPAQDLIAYHLARDNRPAAEHAARAFLQRVPDAVPVLEVLGKLLIQSARPAEALAVRRRMLAANPLDAQARWAVALATLATARRQLFDGDAAGSLDTVAAGVALGENPLVGPFAAVETVARRKLGDAAGADAALGRGLAAPGARVAVLYTVAVDAVLGKLKPADRKRSGEAFAAALDAPCGPADAATALAAFDQYAGEGVVYRGSKAHATKLGALALAAADQPGTETEFEYLIHRCGRHEVPKLVGKLADVLRKRFPLNPVFALAAAEAMLGGRAARGPVLKLLTLAARAAEARHRATADRAARLADAMFGIDLRGPTGG